MITMLHYDSLKNPVGDSLGVKKGDKPGGKTNPAQHAAYLEQHPYDQYKEEDMKNVSGSILSK